MQRPINTITWFVKNWNCMYINTTFLHVNDNVKRSNLKVNRHKCHILDFGLSRLFRSCCSLSSAWLFLLLTRIIPRKHHARRAEGVLEVVLVYYVIKIDCRVRLHNGFLASSKLYFIKSKMKLVSELRL